MKKNNSFPVLQVALDFVEIERALKLANEAVNAGTVWLEAGTPLIKSEGLDAVRRLRKEFPQKTIIADMKTMDAGRGEVEAAAKAGANISVVLGAATESTIKQCIEAGKNYGCKISVDLLGLSEPAKRAEQVAGWGADYVSVHVAIDEQMQGKDSLKILKEVSNAVEIPVAVAGGINSESAPLMLAAGADILIVGGAVHKSTDAKVATSIILKAMAENKSIASEFFKRGGEDEIENILRKVSTANLSDAMYRGGAIPGIKQLNPNGDKMIGKVLTVRTLPGDWAKPVAAIDEAQPGTVLVIDAAGSSPAIWGACATHSCQKRSLAGVVINGYIRDIDEIEKSNFPVYGIGIVPNAGEPKGFGEIGVSLNIAGITINSGDWIIGDGCGVVLLPQNKAVEYANRAQDVLETENRLHAEIENGSTLGKVAQVLRWEKN